MNKFASEKYSIKYFHIILKSMSLKLKYFWKNLNIFSKLFTFCCLDSLRLNACALNNEMYD